MNGININLATGWTAATLAAQRRSWTRIRGISSEIKKQADDASWEGLLTLAEQRDQLISDFLSHAICKPLFSTVVSDLEEIKLMHEETMLRISVELERTVARRTLIEEHRQELSDCLDQPEKNMH